MTLRHLLQQTSVLAALLCGLAHAAGPAPKLPTAPSQTAAHPLLGAWSWTLPGKSCAEIYDYRPQGKRVGTSGAEATQADYEVTPMPSLLGFYRVVETVTEGNGQRDCSGDLHEVTDEGVTRFIQFSPKKDQLIVCKTESLQACFGPLKRLPG